MVKQANEYYAFIDTKKGGKFKNLNQNSNNNDFQDYLSVLEIKLIVLA